MEVDFQQIVSNIRKRTYKYLGSGSGRVVFDLANGTVIKAARNNKGIAQNHDEYQISSVDSSSLFAKVLCVSDNYRFLIMEKANRINDISYVWKYFNVVNNKELRAKEELKEIADKHNLLLSDFGRSENWGEIKGKPVIIDYGFTKKVKKAFY